VSGEVQHQGAVFGLRLVEPLSKGQGAKRGVPKRTHLLSQKVTVHGRAIRRYVYSQAQDAAGILRFDGYGIHLGAPPSAVHALRSHC
jgi:hypothetical protein